jgi:ribosomal protein L37AE/L43A
MNYAETLKAVDTIKALQLIEIEAEQHGSYVYYPCTECGQRAVIKAYGDKKNVWYCPECKSKGQIISLVMKFKGIEWEDAKKILKEKAVAFSTGKIKKELKKEYKLDYDRFLEQQRIPEDICKSLGIGRPEGKTMLSGCIAFTVYDEIGKKIAYYGIRLKDGKAVFHNSFNPELYLYNFHNINPIEEVFFTTDMLECARLISKGQQAVCNFGLPYLSNTHLGLLQKCKYISFIYETKNLEKILKQAYQDLQIYIRVLRKTNELQDKKPNEM